MNAWESSQIVPATEHSDSKVSTRGVYEPVNFWLKSKSSTLPSSLWCCNVGQGWLLRSAYDRKPQIGFLSIWLRNLPQLHLQMFHGGLRCSGGVNGAWCLTEVSRCSQGRPEHARESWGWECPSHFCNGSAADSYRSL